MTVTTLRIPSVSHRFSQHQSASFERLSQYGKCNMSKQANGPVSIANTYNFSRYAGRKCTKRPPWLPLVTRISSSKYKKSRYPPFLFKGRVIVGIFRYLKVTLVISQDTLRRIIFPSLPLSKFFATGLYYYNGHFRFPMMLASHRLGKHKIHWSKKISTHLHNSLK